MISLIVALQKSQTLKLSVSAKIISATSSWGSTWSQRFTQPPKEPIPFTSHHYHSLHCLLHTRRTLVKEDFRTPSSIELSNRTQLTILVGSSIILLVCNLVVMILQYGVSDEGNYQNSHHYSHTGPICSSNHQTRWLADVRIQPHRHSLGRFLQI